MLRSLRARLILLVSVAFLPMLAITARDVVRERNALLRRAHDAAERRVEIAVAAQRDLISDGRRYLGAVAMLPSVGMADSQACARTVSRVRQLLDAEWSFARTLASGEVDCQPDEREAEVVAVTVRAPGPLATGDGDGLPVTIGSYGRDARTGEPVISLLVPLRDSGSTAPSPDLRRLQITMHMTWVRPLVQETLRDSQAVIAIVDADRRVIVRYPAVAYTPELRLPSTPAYDEMVAMRDGRSEGPGADGVMRVWIFRQLPSPDGTPVFISVGIPSAPLLAVANRGILRSTLVLGFTVLLVLLAAWWAAERFMLRDVRALLGATEGISRGELSVRTGLSDKSGEIGQLAEAFDVMASKLEHRQERMAHAQKMESVGQLAGGVAHDFNNLLTAIVANTEAAKEAVADGHPAQAELDQVLHAARRSGQLTRQLLSFARQQTFATRVMTLDRLLDNLLPLLQRLIGEHIKLQVECDPELRPTRIDPTQVEQAIVNLAVNARDAMPGGGTLTIGIRNLNIFPGTTLTDEGNPPGRWVALTVSDTGTGMSADVLRRVFEPFFTTKPVGSGTGLGLAMVYGTARQHGGHVHVTSEPGRGTVVRMLIPAEEHAELSNETPAFGVSAAGTGRGDETILLVEDERAVRAVGARLLRSRGYDVIEAEDGEAALALVADDVLSSVDLVVTDLVMPRLGGAEMVQRLRQRRPALPVLLVSGYSETGVPSALLEAPATQFLEKPFNARSLLNAVRGLLDP